MLLVATAGACTFSGTGEGARYVGRVTSVSTERVCLGPSSSSPRATCGTVPDGVPVRLEVGDCASLFDAGSRDTGVVWSASDLEQGPVDDKDCG